MNTKANGDLINENVPKRTQQQQQTQSSVSISADDIRSIVRETVQDVLKENGLLVESTKKSNEIFKFRVGQHIFEGKLLKIRKVSE
jgi:CRISPR/Cas system type I-B associated protein Csh2 (Cas7 group RAMP superfamily)